jgi:signal transduction histidine kinase
MGPTQIRGSGIIRTAPLRDGEAVDSEEIEIARGDGTRGVVRFTAVPVRDREGRVQAAVLTGFDMTEQRRRSMSHRFLADAGTLLTSSLDYTSTLRNLARLAVPALADWCTVDLLDNSGEIERVAVEHTDAKRAASATQLARRHPPTLDSEVGVERVIRTGISELITEVTPEVIARFTRNGRQRRFLGELGIRSVMIVPMVARGSPLGTITFVSAESGRRYNADDLEVAEELATRAALAVENSRLFDQSRAASEAKSDFLAVMSHELRTPLTAIIGYAELLQLGVPDPVTPRQHEQAERIEVSARNLLQLIEEILTLVTLESGARRVHREEVDVNKLLRRAVAIIEPMAKAKNLPLSVSFAAGDPMLRSDADKLLQILLNLLSNAVKFTEAGGIQLNASTEGEMLVLEVRDTGIGLGGEHLQRIFEPFWQVERPITRRAGGTGLGLTISRRLADLLGAEIQVDSEQGKGSTFTVRLPL